jgi:hypothetical protein
MAVRLSVKLGIVNERDRLPDSPDTAVVVEPSIGSIARSKGQLYLLVTSMLPGPRAREATRLVAETVRNDYYYDESAGIRVCLEKVISAANKKLAHHRDRLGMTAAQASGPIGVAVAVVRGSELYVATVGPAEAYLIRGARLSTLPDPHRDRGLPATELFPDVWRGEITVGDSLVLVSPNIVARLGLDELKDALVTLHPQSAMEHLHHRFTAAGGSGSDGAIALEATEVAVTQRQRTLVPVRADEPLAGAPDRSPIPLADSVTDGVAAVSAGARQAREAAGGAAGRWLRGLQDRLPHRSAVYRRVTPYATKQETRRRAAVALLALVAVVGLLGVAVWFVGSSGPTTPIASLTAGQRALEAARADIDEVWSPGVDLVEGDPQRARDLLEDAYTQLATADDAGVSASTITPLRSRVEAGLDDLFGVVEVRPTVAYDFTGAQPAVDLSTLVQGPDGRPYAIDSASGSVIRIDTRNNLVSAVLTAGTKVGSTTVGTPRLMTIGGPDLLVLDSENVLWRWTPADTKGRGTLTKVTVRDSASWGNDVKAIGTFCTAADCSLYNLYVVDASERQILAYAAAADGSGYPRAPTGRLATARDVSGVTDLYIDGDIWVADDGLIERYVSGRDDGWRSGDPGDALLRPAPAFGLVASGSPRRQGRIYGWDGPNDRLLVFDKSDGGYREQYRLAGDQASWKDLRGLYIVPGVEDGPATVVWIDKDRLMSALLETAIGGTASPSPSPVPTAGASGSPESSASPDASATP